MSNKTRGVRSKVYLDILRIIAIFLVIFNHAPGYNKAIGYYDGENIKNIIFYMIGTFTKINVPLFLMVSGALLLGKEENWDVILKKRILRMFIVLLLAHLIIYIENICVVGIEKGSLFTLVGAFFLRYLQILWKVQ